MQIAVISLDDEVGRIRREGSGLGEFLWSPGVLPEEVPEFVRAHFYPSRYSKARLERLMGAFAAHLRAWRTVAAMGGAAVILEDDAKLARPIPDGLPKDTVTLLGGVFKGFGSWDSKEPRGYEKEGFLDAMAGYAPGINKMPTKDGRRIRWVMAVAYYLPEGMAAKLLEAVEETKMETLRSPDNWLNAYATHFVWPPPFVDQAAPSQCLTPADSHGSDFYCDGLMLRRAKRLGVTVGELS